MNGRYGPMSLPFGTASRAAAHFLPTSVWAKVSIMLQPKRTARATRSLPPAVRMIGQRNRNNSPANALPAGGRHDGRCTLLVQHAIADPYIGRGDQFSSHGHYLHRATDTAIGTGLLESQTHRPAWTFQPTTRDGSLLVVDDQS